MHHENPYVPRVSRILRYRRGHGVLTHNPKVAVESVATLPFSSASGLGFDLGRQESPGPGFEMYGSNPAPATKKTLGIPTFLRVFSRPGTVDVPHVNLRQTWLGQMNLRNGPVWAMMCIYHPVRVGGWVRGPLLRASAFLRSPRLRPSWRATRWVGESVRAGRVGSLHTTCRFCVETKDSG